jgi:hypothetical protein
MQVYLEFDRLYRYLEKDKITFELILQMERYVNMASVQLQRLRNDEKEMVASPGGPIDDNKLEKKIAFDKYHGDLHFFITCVDKVYKTAIRLNKHLSNPGLNDIIKEYKKLDSFRDVRNFLEHFDERISSNPNFRSTINSINYYYGTEKDQVFIGKEALNPVYKMYESIIDILDEHLAPQKPHIDQLWKQWNLELHVSKGPKEVTMDKPKGL